MANNDDLAGKNSKRVAAQVQRQMKLQRARFVSHIILSIALLAFGVVSFFVSIIPTVVQITCLALLPFSFFGVYADHRLYREQQTRFNVLQRRTSGQP